VLLLRWQLEHLQLQKPVPPLLAVAAYVTLVNERACFNAVVFMHTRQASEQTSTQLEFQ